MALNARKEEKQVSLEQASRDQSLKELLEGHGIDPREIEKELDDIQKQAKTFDEPPKRKLLEIGGNEFGCYFVVGNKRWGKSTWLEWAAGMYKEGGYFMMDLFDAGDFESAYWGIRTCKFCHQPVPFNEKVCPTPTCRMTPKEVYEVLLVVPEYMECTIQDPNYKLFTVDEGDSECLPRIVKMAMREDRIVSLAAGLFNNDHLFKMLTEWFYQWIQLNRDIFRRDTCIVLREAADVAFSRGKGMSQYQTHLKKAMINFIRKAGHFRTIVLFDSQRFMGLDIGVRGNIPYVIVKRHSSHNMPTVVKDLNDRINEQRYTWYYDYNLPPEVIDPVRPEVTYLRKNEFYVIFDDGEYALGVNHFPTFHHKGPRDYFDTLAGMTFNQELYRFQESRQLNTIKDVPKRPLIDLCYALNDKYGLATEDLANLFQRKKPVINRWLREAREGV